MPTARLKKKIPAHAFRLAVGRLAVGRLPLAAAPAAAPTEPDADDAPITPIPVAILARTPDAVNHWYFGPMVHDLAGCQTKERFALDWCHNDDQIIGFADNPRVDASGLVADGQLTPFSDDDPAAEIAAKGAAGVPYECSIDWRGGATIMEEVGPGATAQANGQTFAGPVTIVRQWTLRRVAICPSGVDGGTAATFSQPTTGDHADEVEVEVFSTPATTPASPETMTQPPPASPAPPAATETPDSPAPPAAAPIAAETTTAPAPPAPAADPPAAPGPTAEPGATAGEPLPAPVSPTAAADSRLAQLESDLAAARDERDQLRQQLAAAQALAGIGAGQAAPVTFRTHETPDKETSAYARLVATYGENLARVIAHTRIARPQALTPARN